MYRKYIKRLIDMILSGCAIIFLSPIILVYFIMLKLKSNEPVWFTQKRVGRNKRLFNIIKIRTMRTDAPHDVPTHQLQNPEAYMTRHGLYLRKTSLDELPQLINILKGDMSIVGPRPALWNQVDLIAEREKYGANDIRPGLTGWAQINGRDELEILEKARLDGEYVQRMSFLFDARCIFGTFISFFERKNSRMWHGRAQQENKESNGDT